ncbi:glycosyltransferase [Streptomyces sp. NPDC086783]|uniref:glycosyltransferase n=1 Tax=Streptomyces sp. NPDC086783 TaxID=3365758 RepID=UPI003816B76A
MRILFSSNPLIGRLLPLLPLARALNAEGQHVGFSTAREMAAVLEPEGFDLLLFGPTAAEVTAEATRRAGLDILFQPAGDLAAEYFAGVRVDLLADEMLARAGEWLPDIIVCEDCDLVGPLVAQALGVPCAVVATGPAPAPNMLDAMASALRGRYAERGLQPPSEVPSGRWLLDCCPASVNREGRTPPSQRIPMRPEPGRRAEQTPGTSRRSPDGRPRVLVTLDGEPAPTDRGRSPVLQALSGLDIDVVITDGNSWDAEMLDGAAVVVHDGSTDITFAAVARGIPALVLPLSFDQRVRARGLDVAGAGVVLEPCGQRPDLIAAGLLRLLTDARFSGSASRVREEIAAMPSASEVARWLVAAVSREQGSGPPA